MNNNLAVLSEKLQKYGPSPYSDEIVIVAAKALSQAASLVEGARIDKDDFFYNVQFGNYTKPYAPFNELLKNSWNPMRAIYEISKEAYMQFSNELVCSCKLRPNDYIWGVSAFLAPWEHIEPFSAALLSMSDYGLGDFYLAKIKQEHAQCSTAKIYDFCNDNLFNIIDYDTLCEAVRLNLEKRFLSSDILGRKIFISNIRQLKSVFRVICYKVGKGVLDIGVFPKDVVTLPSEEPRLCNYNYDCENCPHAEDGAYAEGIEGFD